MQLSSRDRLLWLGLGHHYLLGDSLIERKCSSIQRQKMPSIQRRISIEFRNPAHQLSADILGSYLWRYLYLPSISHLVLLACKNNHFISAPFSKRNSSPLHVFTSKAFRGRHSCNSCRLLGSLGNFFLLLLYTV